MEKIYRVFSELNKYHNPDLVLDPSDQVIDKTDFECHDLKSI